MGEMLSSRVLTVDKSAKEGLCDDHKIDRFHLDE